MNTPALALAATLFATAAVAQTAATPGNSAPGATSNAPMRGVSPSTGATPGTGLVDRNTGTAAAGGDRNQAVATTDANAPQPARGANSFSEGEARRRIQARGFTEVTGLRKDEGGVWRGRATRDGRPADVWLDYKGNVGPLGGATRAGAAPAGDAHGNPPGTAAGRAADRAVGTNATGATPGANGPDGTRGNPPGTVTGRAADALTGTPTRPDGTPGNPPGTAVGRAVDRTLGTNATGANPGGNAGAVTSPAR